MRELPQITGRENGHELTARSEGMESVHEVSFDYADVRIFAIQTRRGYAILSAVTLALTLVSAIVLCNHFTNPDSWTGQIASLDEKASAVTGMSAMSLGLSGGLSLLPGDAASSIADKFADLSVDFGIVLGVTYLEKYMLTIGSLLSFRFLIPAGLVLLWISELQTGAQRFVGAFRSIGVKCLVFGVLLFALVPASLGLSSLIERTYQLDAASVAAAAEAVESEAAEATDAVTGESDAPDVAEASGSTEAEESDSEGFSLIGAASSLWDSVTGAAESVTTAVQEVASDAVEGVTETVTSAVDDATSAFNRLLESFVVMVITTCVIPLLTLALMVWFAKTLLSVDVPAPVWSDRPSGAAMRRRARSEASQVRSNLKAARKQEE